MGEERKYTSAQRSLGQMLGLPEQHYCRINIERSCDYFRHCAKANSRLERYMDWYFQKGEERRKREWM